jgi:hypothetical protein
MFAPPGQAFDRIERLSVSAALGMSPFPPLVPPLSPLYIGVLGGIIEVRRG